MCGGGGVGGGGGGGGGRVVLRVWNFQEGYQRNSMWNFQRLIKNKVEFPRVIRKKLRGISKGLCFWPWNFQEGFI